MSNIPNVRVIRMRNPVWLIYRTPTLRIVRQSASEKGLELYVGVNVTVRATLVKAGFENLIGKISVLILMWR